MPAPYVCAARRDRPSVRLAFWRNQRQITTFSVGPSLALAGVEALGLPDRGGAGMTARVRIALAFFSSSHYCKPADSVVTGSGRLLLRKIVGAAVRVAMAAG
jgi:hypothetical protein